jgi:hypothetical protein
MDNRGVPQALYLGCGAWLRIVVGVQEGVAGLAWRYPNGKVLSLVVKA